MGQNILKIQGPKGIQRIEQKKNWKTESAGKADSAFLIKDTGMNILSSKKSRVNFLVGGTKADSAFVLIKLLCPYVIFELSALDSFFYSTSFLMLQRLNSEE